MFGIFGESAKERKALKLFDTVERDMLAIGASRDLLSTYMSFLVNDISEEQWNELVLAACRTHMFAVCLLTGRLKSAGLSDALVSKYCTKMMREAGVVDIKNQIIKAHKHTCQAPDAMAIAEYGQLFKVAALFNQNLNKFGVDDAKEAWAIAAYGRYDLMSNLRH